MKLLKIDLLILLFLVCFTGTSLLAQQEPTTNENKIVIITKVVDEDGNVKTEKIIKEGKDADVFLFKEGDGSQLIEIDVDTDGIEREVDVRIDGLDDIDILEWDGEKGAFPEDALKILEEKNIEIDINEDHNIFRFNRDDTPNRACLGVMIGTNKNVENINGEETITVEGASEFGVPILKIIEDSGAEDAGLLKADVITKINNTEVLTLEEVLETLSPMEPGAVVAIDYLRDGQAAQVNATLKTCASPVVKELENIRWKTGGNDHVIIIKEGKRQGETKRKVIIKKGKKTPEEVLVEGALIDAEEDFNPALENGNQLDLEAIDIFPNPTDSKLTIQFSAEPVPTTLSIVDMMGREVYTETLKDFDGNYNKLVDLSQATVGTLILSIRQGDKIFSEKLILQKSK